MSSKKIARIAVLLFVAVAVFAAMATSASAAPNSTSLCSNCHSGAGPAPTVSLVSDIGGTATYSVQQVGSDWAAFDGSAWLAAGNATTGTFTAPTGHAVTVFSVSGFPGPIGSTTIGDGGPTTYTITPSAGAGGSISPAGAQTVASGSNVTFTITPNAGYQVDALSVDGVAVAAATSYTFLGVAANHTIAVTFRVAAPTKCTATITLAGLKAGVLKRGKTVTIKGAVKPAHAGSVKLTIQRKVGAKWVKIKSVSRAMNATSGAYSYGYKPTKTGSYRVKAAAAKTAAFTAAATAYKSFKVR